MSEAVTFSSSRGLSLEIELKPHTYVIVHFLVVTLMKCKKKNVKKKELSLKYILCNP